MQLQKLLLQPNREGANEKLYCVKLTSANMRIHYKLLPCEKLHYKAQQGVIELSALTLSEGRAREESSQTSPFLPEASLKQGEDITISGDAFLAPYNLK